MIGENVHLPATSLRTGLACVVQYVLWAQWWGACLGEACLLWVAQWECRDAPEESWEGWL